MTDTTKADESTDNRLLLLEQRYSVQVRIYPADCWHVLVEAHGDHTLLSLSKTINGKDYIMSDTEIEHIIDIAIEELRYKSEQRELWNQWCRNNGLR